MSQVHKVVKILTDATNMISLSTFLSPPHMNTHTHTLVSRARLFFFLARVPNIHTAEDIATCMYCLLFRTKHVCMKFISLLRDPGGQWCTPHDKMEPLHFLFSKLHGQWEWNENTKPSFYLHLLGLMVSWVTICTGNWQYHLSQPQYIC